jgi:alkaline phosphatase D
MTNLLLSRCLDPLGLITGSGPSDYDSFANENPAILGREFELQDLLSFINDNNIENVVSISSDVHFAAHVSMSPERAEGNFTNFKQLEEFVIGPIHGGAFGPNYMDTSFGAAYEFGELLKVP